MAAGFHEGVVFPTDISYESQGGPEFSTDIVAYGNGSEQRNVNWTYPRARWNVIYGVKTTAQFRVLREFFYARRGRAYGFRFFDHDDHEAEDEPIGTGDGVTTQFQLIKSYGDSPYELTRKITKILQPALLVIEVNGNPDSIYTVDNNTGIVTWDTPPPLGGDIRAWFSFHVPMRFDTDWLGATLTTLDIRGADIPLVEVTDE